MRSLANLLALPVLVLIMWIIVGFFGVFNPFLLPPFEVVVKTGLSLVKSGELWIHIFASSMRALGGFCIAALIALPLAFFCHRSHANEQRFKLILESLRFIPPLSLIPLLILWLGIGEASKISIVILASFFPIYLNTLSGFKQIDNSFNELSKVLKLNKLETFVNIEFPGALPSIMTGLRLGFGYSWRALVGAELIAASSGLGYLIGDASEMSQTDKVFVGILSIAVLGIIGDQLFQILALKLFPWKKNNVSGNKN